jgi:hypothetical protein
MNLDLAGFFEDLLKVPRPLGLFKKKANRLFESFECLFLDGPAGGNVQIEGLCHDARPS